MMSFDLIQETSKCLYLAIKHPRSEDGLPRVVKAWYVPDACHNGSRARSAAAAPVRGPCICPSSLIFRRVEDGPAVMFEARILRLYCLYNSIRLAQIEVKEEVRAE